MTHPKDPQAELLEADKAAINKICDDYSMDEALKTFYERVQAHQQELLSELLGELETPVYPEIMAYVEMVKKASENGKYDDMFDNGFKAARSVIEKYREGL